MNFPLADADNTCRVLGFIIPFDALVADRFLVSVSCSLLGFFSDKLISDFRKLLPDLRLFDPIPLLPLSWANTIEFQCQGLIESGRLNSIPLCLIGSGRLNLIPLCLSIGRVRCCCDPIPLLISLE